MQDKSEGENRLDDRRDQCFDRSIRLNELIHRAKAASRKTAAVRQNSAA